MLIDFHQCTYKTNINHLKTYPIDKQRRRWAQAKSEGPEEPIEKIPRHTIRME